MKKTKQPKQIKSFTVDGEIYTWLVERLAESGESGFTVSSLLNDYLRDLHFMLKGILEYFEKNNIPVSRAWTIKDFISEYKAYPPELEDMIRPDLKECFEDEIEREAELMIMRYESEKNLKIARRKKNIVYGVCGQCTNWDFDGEYCEFRKTSIRSFERCENFKAKKGIPKEELVEVKIRGRMKVTKWSIVID